MRFIEGASSERSSYAELDIMFLLTVKEGESAFRPRYDGIQVTRIVAKDQTKRRIDHGHHDLDFNPCRRSPFVGPGNDVNALSRFVIAEKPIFKFIHFQINSDSNPFDNK